MEEEIVLIEKKSGCGRRLFLGAVVLVTAFVFRNEVGFLWRLIKAVLLPLVGLKGGEIPPLNQIVAVLGFMAANVLGVIGLSLLVIFVFSQVVLPVNSGAQRRQVSERLFSFFTGWRTPVIFIREGQLAEGFSEKTRERGGVAVVDLNSAIVLERQWVPLAVGPVDPRRPMARVGGPGVVFIGWGERLRGQVSLRKQFRINLGVRAYTSDGIEVQTNVYTIFTLGQPPTVIKVAYCGDDTPDAIRVLSIDETTKKIKAISDELDTDDKAEIHAFAQQYRLNKDASAPLAPAERHNEYPPFEVDEKRILAAIYSQARSVADSKLDHWTEFPPHIATEVFRNMLSQVTYDQLYLPDDPSKFPLMEEFKPRFQRTMRYLGVMAYQFVYRFDGESPAVGQKVEYRQFRVSPIQELQSPKVLRDRGIKIVQPSFSVLKPSDPLIRQQRLENWRARWQREIDIAKASQELEVSRILNHARAEKQQEMIAKLSQILQMSSFSEEALILRIFQALEDVATDPAARRILPRDTINMLRNLRLWLLPDENVLPTLLQEKLSSSEEE